MARLPFTRRLPRQMPIPEDGGAAATGTKFAEWNARLGPSACHIPDPAGRVPAMVPA